MRRAQVVEAGGAQRNTTPASFAQFGQSLAFAEQTLTEVLVEHLARRGVEPATWDALKLIRQLDPGDVDITILTLQAITQHAIEEEEDS